MTMTKPTSHTNTILISLLCLSLIGNGSLGYFIYSKNQDLASTTATAAATKSELTTSLTEASSSIATLTYNLNSLSEQYAKLQEDYEQEQSKNEDFEDQIRDISKTVGTLDKLAKTDEELLQKYSKVYFLNENYAPSSLKDIPEEYILAGREPQEFHGDALPFLEDLIEDAKDDDIDLKILSAYRSFGTQAGLKGNYLQTYGSGANAFSADQGYSEHQLGTTVDITIDSIGGAYTSFKDTEAYQWLLKNAYKHGFVLSYPENNSYYVFEPWHWRFVGEDLARYLHRNDKNFYDLDQRTIDTYLVSLFD